jgi:chemosensory pili system protein ChpC
MVQHAGVIHSQIIITETGRLLVPNTAIAEIVHYAPPQAAGDGPQWLLGTMEWRGLRIPVVSFERATGAEPEESGTSRRIAVMNGIYSGDALRFYAMVIQSNPSLINVSPANVTKHAGADRAKLQLQQVTVDDAPAVIPDLRALETMLSEAGARTERVH